MVNRHVRAQLLRLAENRLSPNERAAVHAHLAECAECRAAAAGLAELADVLQAVPAALQGLPNRAARQWPAVWARVQAPAARLRSPAWRVYVSLVAALLVFLVAVPGRDGGRGGLPTAGLPQTPAYVIQTPLAAAHTAAEPAGETRGPASLVSAASVTASTAAARPMPVPTPVPGPGG